MTYAQEKVRYGKQPVQLVEIHLERCTRTFGSAPCTAAIGVTGTKKCFNTFGTCQDTANFNTVPIVYRFATTRLHDYIAQPSGSPVVFPTLLSVDTAPTVLTPGKGLGVRSSVKVSILDHPWHDTFFDPYLADRSYDADEQGTFWSRFLSRNQYYVNRKMVVKTGFLNDADEFEEANFVTRTYVITKITGPMGGKVTIEAKDPLKLADNDKVKWPTPSKATLSAGINSSVTTFTVIDSGDLVRTQLLVGALDQPYLRIDREIVRVTAWSGTGTLSITVNRASCPTFYDGSFVPAASHSAGAIVQTTWLYDNKTADSVVYHLLNDVVKLDTAYLPTVDWASEIANGFTFMTFSRLLVEPKGVKDLLTEITQHGIMLWWDERATVVKLRPLRFYALLGNPLNEDDNLIANSVGVTEDTASLATRVWINYAIAAPQENPKELKSYRSTELRVDADAELVEAYDGETVMEINSQWMPPGGGVASQSQVLLRQYSQVRKIITFAMDPKDDTFWVGDVVSVATHLVQDDEGYTAARNYLITSVEEQWAAGGVVLKYAATEQFNFLRAGVIAPTSLASVTYSTASSDQRGRYAFITRNVGTFADGTPGYQIT